MPSHHMGWLRDLPDQRDHLYTVARPAPLPLQIDLRAGCPPVYDQGQLGSCTANALAAAVEFDERKQGVTNGDTPSRLFLYYNERAREHTVASDSGAMLRDGIKCLAKQGDCPESLWPYDITRYASKPPPACYQEAAKHRISSYMRLMPSLYKMQHCLSEVENLCAPSRLEKVLMPSLYKMQHCLSEGYPFVFGMTVYESFESAEVASTGIVPMPARSEKVLGGHAILCVGYDSSKQVVIVRNSWGASWGDGGYFYLPYTYLMSPDLTGDFWTIRTVMQGATPGEVTQHVYAGK